MEYQLPGINQIQVKAAIGMTFAGALRAIVRQDPDIIMVGEMRDLETARIAVQSALTGHVVLSTLHTNDAASGVTRLLDMGVEDYLLTSTVNGILAQRLVRRLCPHCREPYERPARAGRQAGAASAGGAPITLYRAVGCDQCNATGYRGRLVITEVLLMTDAVRRRSCATPPPPTSSASPSTRAWSPCTTTACARPWTGAPRWKRSCAWPRRPEPMPLYSYKAVKPDGEAVEGELRGAGRGGPGPRPPGRGPDPDPDPPRRGAARCAWARTRRRRLSQKEIGILTRELATLLEAGLTLDRSLQILVELTAEEHLVRVLSDLQQRVRGGATFSAALEAAGRPVPPPLRQHGHGRGGERRPGSGPGRAWRTIWSGPRSCARPSPRPWSTPPSCWSWRGSR